MSTESSPSSASTTRRPSEVARFELIDGMVHCISLAAGARLIRLADHYEMVWATGWEEKANDYLPEHHRHSGATPS